MKTFRAVAGAIIGIIAIPAIVAGQQAKSVHAVHVPRCELGAAQVKVPLEMSQRKPSIFAKVNGKGPFRFFLDTGAGAAIVFDQKLADELGLTKVGSIQMGDPSNPTGIEAGVVQVDSVTIGEAVFRDVGGISHERSGLYKGDDAPRGVIGFPLFANCLITIHYPKKEIQLEKGEIPASDSANVVPFEIGEGGIPQFRVNVAGTDLPAHVDSGAMGAISIPANMESKFKWKKAPAIVGRGRTVTGEFTIRGGTLDGEVRFAGQTFSDPRVDLSPMLDRIGFVNIGSGLLRDFVVTIDSQNKRMQITSSAGKD